MIEMYFRNRVLSKEMNHYQKIIIYGTGHFAQEIYPRLVECGLKKNIVCFTQTEEGEPVSIDGIPVIGIKKLNYNKAECVVLIAVSKLYTDEIKQTLLEYEYPHIVSLMDYRIHYTMLESDYRDLVIFKDYCEYIADWYVRTQECNRENESVILQKIWARREGRERKTDTNLIVIISGHLSSRTIKIAGALKREKYDVVLLSYFNGTNPWNLDELQKIGIPIFPCKHIAEMLYYALQYDPLVYFFEPRWGDCLWAEIMLKNKQYWGKIVLGLYDIMNDGFTESTEDELATERYALEHADGIVWRWFSKEYLEEKKGFRYQGKSIQFPDYCDHKTEEIVPKKSDSSVVKLCFVCGYGDDYVGNRACETEYADWARIGEILEKIGNRKDCVFHFYTGALRNGENIVRCEQYEMQYKNFKCFFATEHNKLLKKLEDYDYGCELWTNGEAPPDDMLMPVERYYGSQYNNSVRNAYFDFLSAGLPVITTQASKMRDYLSADDVMIRMTLSDLDIDFLKGHKQYYKAKVTERRKEWDIDNQISRLIQFFQEV